MARKFLKRELVEEEEIAPGQWRRTYKKVYVEVPDVPDEVAKVEEKPPEPVVEKLKLILTMSNTKAELLAEAERLGLNVNSGNTKAEILVAINAAQE
tara:strand:- start:220 stop:510 length:291 start_codon:yes stop_codon:yes gene_type:complete